MQAIRELPVSQNFKNQIARLVANKDVVRLQGMLSAYQTAPKHTKTIQTAISTINN